MKIILILILTFFMSNVIAKESVPDSAIYSDMDLVHPIWAKRAMIATQEQVASNVGLTILEKGGNAVDASVAIGFALAVTLPRAGNIGGGGFMLIYDSKSKQSIAIDYRETAPLKASKDMFLDENKNAITELSKYHGLASGTPGTVAGLITALKAYGTMSLSDVMAPAIELAEKGIIVTADLHNSLIGTQKRLKKWDSTKEIFFKDDKPLPIGDILIQKDLANSLKLIAKEGQDGFYKGATAKKIVDSINEAGGNITMDDLANYKAIIRKPLKGNYRGFDVISMPPPSSGGTHLIQMLNILENFDLASMGHNSAKYIHYLVETMKLAYADRSKYLGDNDFVKVPVTELISKEYANKLSKTITDNKVTPAAEILPGAKLLYESDQTTHFSVVDKNGNMVSNTYTLNFSYGSGLVAKGTGIFMNNEMDDFSVKPGVPNGYGLIGGDANSISPNKRPLSSMTPTFILKNNKPFLVTGTPGGSRIITTILQLILNVVDFNMNIAEATHAIRIHNQWLPDEIRVEKGLSIDTINILKEHYKVVIKAAMGSSQSIIFVDNGLEGSSDPRRANGLAVGY